MINRKVNKQFTGCSKIYKSNLQSDKIHFDFNLQKFLHAKSNDHLKKSNYTNQQNQMMCIFNFTVFVNSGFKFLKIRVSSKIVFNIWTAMRCLRCRQD